MQKIDMIIKREHEGSDEALIYVDAKLNGDDHIFLFDTGAARSLLALNENTKTMKSISKSTSSGAFSTNHYDIVNVNSLNVGYIKETDVVMNRLIHNNNGSESILGLEVICKYSLLFDFTNEEIRLINFDEFEQQRLYDLELSSKNHPYMDVLFDNIKAKALWDTGASITIVDEKFIDNNPTLFTQLGVELGTDSGGISQNTKMYLMKESNIGGMRFKSVRVASVDLSHINASASISMDMILGFPTISQANWYIDFIEKKWAVSNYP